MEKINLNNLGQKSEQEVFDFVASHLLTQKEKSIGYGNLCSYRGDNGLKCAAGCLISEEEYKPEMENRGWRNLINKELVPPQHYILIIELQRIHDWRGVSSWENELKILAFKNDLKWTK